MVFLRTPKVRRRKMAEVKDRFGDTGELLR